MYDTSVSRLFSAVRPENLEEKIIWWLITGTWVIYLFGGLYLVAPVFGWLLVIWAGLKPYLVTPLDHPLPAFRFIPGVWIWGVGMMVMLLALVIAHINFDLGAMKLIKSVFGWAKGWALLALFILIGASLDIRPRLLYRAACVLGAQTLLLVPLFLLAAALHLPDTLYTSPLAILGGSGPEYFTVRLYSPSYDGSFRWQFWAPWAPAAGFVGNILFILSWQEKNCGGAGRVSVPLFLCA